MPVNTPDWLQRHDGRLEASKDGRSWLVYFAGEPQYLLVPTPSQGKFSCRVAQTINGKRLDGDGTYATAEDAVRGGLDDLRKGLGW